MRVVNQLLKLLEEKENLNKIIIYHYILIIILMNSNIYIIKFKVIINNYTFLFFNGVNTFYVNNLNEQHNLSELGLS